MKKLIILVLTAVVANLSFAQELKMTNIASGKEVVFNENKCVRVKKTNGDKVSGRLKLIDANMI